MHNISTLNNKKKNETLASLKKKKKFIYLYAIEYGWKMFWFTLQSSIEIDQTSIIVCGWNFRETMHEIKVLRFFFIKGQFWYYFKLLNKFGCNKKYKWCE